jgi:D-alanyl-D-alanine carboxypeptidase
MLLGGGVVQRGICWSAIGLATVITLTTLSTDVHAKRAQRARSADSYQPAYASIVVDANSGAVMQATNADAPRHPASLTKIMTLYLLFERLEQGKIKLTTELPVSARAAAQAPSKLSLKPGGSIRVEPAIRAIVTKSANDVAVIVAEAIGGDEPAFAKMMTAKARALGMNQTIYRNASGLPDDQQITTARDQAILGRAIQDRFPNYYHYFATRTFEYRGHAIRNHNHLLGTVDGVDGIKTGYIRASGFNIVTSVRRANHHLVAVVFGGRSAPARDARVRSLIDNNINIAAVKRTAPPVVEGWETALARKDPIDKDKKEKDDDRTGSAPLRVASVTRASSDAPLPGSTDPIKPNAVKTVAVHPGSMRTAALTPLPSESRQLTPTPTESAQATITTVLTVKNGEPQTIAPTVTAPTAPDSSIATPGPAPAPATKVASAVSSIPVPAPVPEPTAKPRSGWIIQIGALPDEKDALQRLDLARTKIKDLLGKAESFTERVEKGEKVLFRARFAGLEKNQAESACKHLKRSDIPCILVKN